MDGWDILTRLSSEKKALISFTPWEIYSIIQHKTRQGLKSLSAEEKKKKKEASVFGMIPPQQGGRWARV